MSDRSELNERLEGTIVNLMQEKVEAFNQRAKVYAAHKEKETIKASLRETDRLINSARDPVNIETLNKLKKETIEKLNNINKVEKGLEGELESLIIINYAEGQASILLPLNPDNREKTGLWSRLYKSLNIAAGYPEVPLSYCNLSVIKAPKRRSKKIIKEIKSLPNEKDFKEAKIKFKIEELNLLLDLSKIGVAETAIRYGIRPAETKEELEAIYSIKDISKRLNLTYSRADYVVRRFLKEKGMGHKKPGKGKPFEFKRGEFNSIVSYYETEGKIMKIGKKPTLEETYRTNDVAKALNLSENGARFNIRKYFENKGLKTPGRAGTYSLTKSQFEDLISSYKTRGIRIKPAEEKPYTAESIAETLGITRRSAHERIQRYYKRHNIKHKPRTEWALTQKQFEDVTVRRETIGANAYRNDVIEMIRTGKKDEQIRGDIKRKYALKNPGIVQGTINLYKHKISRGEI